MTIETQNLPADLVPLMEATKLLPRSVTRQTLARWISTGVRGVVLRSVLIGGRRFTCAGWLETFIADSSAPTVASEPTTLRQRSRMDREQARRMEAAKKRLEVDGI